MKLRLLLLQECNRTCKGCCNKDWDLDGLPKCQSYAGYESIFLTGGEVMLYPEKVKQVTAEVRKQTDAPVIIYTAKCDDVEALIDVLKVVDGVTLTLHTRKDAPLFREFNAALQRSGVTGKSLRLNVFNGITVGDTDTSGWQVKTGIRWIKDCPLPTDEVFMQVAA